MPGITGGGMALGLPKKPPMKIPDPYNPTGAPAFHGFAGTNLTGGTMPAAPAAAAQPAASFGSTGPIKGTGPAVSADAIMGAVQAGRNANDANGTNYGFKGPQPQTIDLSHSNIGAGMGNIFSSPTGTTQETSILAPWLTGVKPGTMIPNGSTAAPGGTMGGPSPAARSAAGVGAPGTPAQLNAGADQWADIMSQYGQGKKDIYNQSYADEATNARRNAEMNAQSGGGLGGSFAGGQAQVQLGGMQQRQQALQNYNKQGLELKMAHLDQLIKQAEASNDRNLSRELQAEADKTAMALKQMDTKAATNASQVAADSAAKMAKEDRESSLGYKLSHMFG